MEYRNGDWEGTIDATKKSMELESGKDGFDLFFLGMTHGQMGDEGKGRDYFEKAVRWMKDNRPNDRDLKRMRKEAGGLFEDSVEGEVKGNTENVNS